MPYRHLGLAALLLAICACQQPRARIMSDSDQDLVGDRSAGAPTYDRLISETVTKLLGDVSAQRAGDDRLRIACLEVENLSAEELGDWQEHLYSLLTTSIARSERYDLISRRAVQAALRETRVSADQLFLPRYRNLFAEALGSAGSPVDAMLFPSLTSGTTQGTGDSSQRNYDLALELVDLESGYSRRVSERVRKEYRR